MPSSWILGVFSQCHTVPPQNRQCWIKENASDHLALLTYFIFSSVSCTVLWMDFLWQYLSTLLMNTNIFYTYASSFFPVQDEYHLHSGKLTSLCIDSWASKTSSEHE